MYVFRLKKRKLIRTIVAGLVLLLIGVFLFTGNGFEPTNNQGYAEVAVFRDGIPGDYEPLDGEGSTRTGPGERGQPVPTLDKDRKAMEKALMEFGMNMHASDKVALDREIPDTRHPECKFWNYPGSLPSTSVVIVFCNEGWSTLLRTVVSVLNRSPVQALKEVLLVDDFSTKDHLKEKLEAWVRNVPGNERVRLIRNRQREGLIRSRSRGAREAKGQVVLFLDAHCEVNRNWLPPLLTPILNNRTVMTVPVVDGVDHTTLAYKPVYEREVNYKGIFEWGMLYKETRLSPKEMATMEHPSQPYNSKNTLSRAPTHAGGLFAIDREYFLTLGGYDPGLVVWGGENYELSFKIWQCGGSIVWVPCSRVGHIYRGGGVPYDFEQVIPDGRKGLVATSSNYRRVAEVWMDEYKENFYTRDPLARQYDMGDISAQLQLRKNLKCKSFKWFMENIAFDVLEKYPLLPKNLYWGELRSVSWDKCLDVNVDNLPAKCQIFACHKTGGNQLFRLNARGQLGVGEYCVEANGQRLEAVQCESGSVDGLWEYKQDTKTLFHSAEEKCLELGSESGEPSLAVCKTNVPEQQWKFNEIVLSPVG